MVSFSKSLNQNKTIPYHKGFLLIFQNFFQICRNGHFKNVQKRVLAMHFGTKENLRVLVILENNTYYAVYI